MDESCMPIPIAITIIVTYFVKALDSYFEEKFAFRNKGFHSSLRESIGVDNDVLCQETIPHEP